MVRNNLIALLIHTLLGAVLYIFGGWMFGSVNKYAVLLILLVFYSLYFVIALLAARFHLFKTQDVKWYHVILPGIVMLILLVILYAFKYQSSSNFFGALVGLFCQPVDSILAISGNRPRALRSIVGYLLQCTTPSAIIWFGLTLGKRNKLDGIL